MNCVDILFFGIILLIFVLGGRNEEFMTYPHPKHSRIMPSTRDYGIQAHKLQAMRDKMYNMENIFGKRSNPVGRRSNDVSKYNHTLNDCAISHSSDGCAEKKWHSGLYDRSLHGHNHQMPVIAKPCHNQHFEY
mgnify:CR=1 FL=1